MMHIAGILISALAIAQEAYANPVAHEKRQEHDAAPAMITPAPAINHELLLWGTKAKDAREIALLAGRPYKVGKRAESDLLQACGANFVDCGNDRCCKAGNICYNDFFSGDVKCQPLGGAGSVDIQELISSYNDILKSYSGLLSGFSFPTIPTTGLATFDYNEFISSYYSALGGLTISSSAAGISSILNNPAFSSDLFGGIATNSAFPSSNAESAASGGDGDNKNGEVTEPKKKSNLAPIIGGVVGGIIVLALITGIIIFLVIKNRKKKRQQDMAGGVVGGSPQSSTQDPPKQYPPVGLPGSTVAPNQPPMGQYPAPTTSPGPGGAPMGGMGGGYPVVPQPGQYQQSPSPGSQNQYGQYPPPAFSPPPPGVSPAPYDPNKPAGYFAPPAGQQFHEMPAQPYGQTNTQAYQQPNLQSPYPPTSSPGVPSPQAQVAPHYAQPAQGPIAEMDASGGK